MVDYLCNQVASAGFCTAAAADPLVKCLAFMVLCVVIVGAVRLLGRIVDLD